MVQQLWFQGAQAVFPKKMLFRPDCSTVIQGAFRLVAGAPRYYQASHQHSQCSQTYSQTCCRHSQACAQHFLVLPGLLLALQGHQTAFIHLDHSPLLPDAPHCDYFRPVLSGIWQPWDSSSLTSRGFQRLQDRKIHLANTHAIHTLSYKFHLHTTLGAAGWWWWALCLLDLVFDHISPGMEYTSCWISNYLPLHLYWIFTAF